MSGWREVRSDEPGGPAKPGGPRGPSPGRSAGPIRRDGGDRDDGRHTDDHRAQVKGDGRQTGDDGAPPHDGDPHLPDHAGWRPVDGTGEPVAYSGAPAADPAWAQERLVHEFMQRPEGRVEEGAVVIRPSLWAALERGLVAFAGISIFVLPFVIAALFGVSDPGPDEPRFVVVVEVFQGLVIPLLFSFVPVVQLAFTRYIIDEEGIRERVQLVSKTDKRVRWEKVTALQHRITLMDRLFGIQRINVIAYGARGTTIRLVGLRRAPRLRRLVAKQMRVNASFDRLLTND